MYQYHNRFTLAGYRFMALSDQDILDFVGENPGAGRDAIRKGVARDVSETTVWRLLKRMVEEGRLEVSGKGRATGYRIAGGAVVRAHLSTPYNSCLLYTSPSPRDLSTSRMPSSA